MKFSTTSNSKQNQITHILFSLVVLSNIDSFGFICLGFDISL